MLPTVPETMIAIEITAPGEPDVLRQTSRQTPRPGPGDVLIRVKAAGVNRPDVSQRQGKYPPPPGASDIPGLEVAGEVAAIGEEVRNWRVGDAVCALVSGGGYAEYCVAPEPQCLPVPKNFDWVQAAALPETFFTVWTNVFERGRLQPSDTLLIHGGSSGIGTTAIQLASTFGARVLVTAGSADKCRACEKLGAERGINYREEDFVAVAKELTGGRGVDVVLDMVGGSYVPRNLEVLAIEGRLVQIAFLQGAKMELNLQPIMTKRLTFCGSTLRPRSIADKGAIAQALKEQVWPRLDSGRIKPVIHATFPLGDAADAHRMMESGDHIGKIVLVA
jgi:putative PIG3 family NAD(P)H quinone oxidoreductase